MPTETEAVTGGVTARVLLEGSGSERTRRARKRRARGSKGASGTLDEDRREHLGRLMRGAAVRQHPASRSEGREPQGATVAVSAAPLLATSSLTPHS
eukprot:782887-Rhodomonas_salina.2